MNLEIISQYFPFLEKKQLIKLERFMELSLEWNQKINLISRKDTEYIVEKHLLPSLSMAKICTFSNNSKVLDVGTGGGFPGIPLAICFPEVNFLLVDSIAKKVNVVESIAKELNLQNVRTRQIRAEELTEQFDFVIGRAVTALPKFVGWIKRRIRHGKKSSLPNGILYLKGGDISEEIKELGIKPTTVFDLSEYFDGKYCQDKCVIYFDKKVLGR